MSSDAVQKWHTAAEQLGVEPDALELEVHRLLSRHYGLPLKTNHILNCVLSAIVRLRSTHAAGDPEQ